MLWGACDISGAHRSTVLRVRAVCESGIQYLKEMMSGVPIQRMRRGGKVNTTRRKSLRTFSPLIICCDIACTELWALTRSCWQHVSYHFTRCICVCVSVIAVIWSDIRFEDWNLGGLTLQTALFYDWTERRKHLSDVSCYFKVIPAQLELKYVDLFCLYCLAKSKRGREQDFEKV